MSQKGQIFNDRAVPTTILLQYWAYLLLQHRLLLRFGFRRRLLAALVVEFAMWEDNGESTPGDDERLVFLAVVYTHGSQFKKHNRSHLGFEKARIIETSVAFRSCPSIGFRRRLLAALVVEFAEWEDNGEGTPGDDERLVFLAIVYTQGSSHFKKHDRSDPGFEKARIVETSVASRSCRSISVWCK